MSKLHYFVLTSLFLLLCGYIFVDSRIHGKLSDSSVEQNLTINEGDGVNLIASKLEKDSLITNRVWIEIYLWVKNKESQVVAGTYALRPNMSIPEIVDIITTGKGKKEDQSITIIEGWSNKQIGEYLAEKGVVTKEEFLNEANSPDKYRPYFSFLQDLPKDRTLEGYLFPDTYNVIKGKTTAEQLVYKMLLNFDTKITDSLREDVKKSGHTLDEIVSMASVVEKEVPQENDRKIVAGIFWDRIYNKQPLQSCATISYILGVVKSQYSFEDTRIDSPYNTYLNKGLPFGPIGNPGLSAVKASIYPQKTDYVYFLSDPKTGETIYSRTLDEHDRNKAEHGL